MTWKLYAVVLSLLCWVATGAAKGNIHNQGNTTNLTIHWHFENEDELISITRSIQELKIENEKSIKELKAENERNIQELKIENENSFNRLETENERSIQELKLENESLRRRLERTEELIEHLQRDYGLKKTEPAIREISLPDSFTASLMNGKLSGVLKIRTSTKSEPFSVYCLNDGNDRQPWTVIQRRVDGSVDFNRNWTDYKNGFGNVPVEYWIGLQRIHEMTSSQPMELRVKYVSCRGEMYTMIYTHFVIGDESEEYVLKELGDFFGEDNILSTQKNKKFSTKDRCHDKNCAANLKIAWWFSDSWNCNLNGKYERNARGKGVNWSTQKDFANVCLIKSVHMAIRPRVKP